jgi:cysteine synthase
MRTIQTPIIITSFRGKVDGSLSLTLTTPELQANEKVEFMNLQGINCMAIFKPTDYQTTSLKVEKKIDGKTPSQRLRAVLYVWWEQHGKSEDFETFYNYRMEAFIDKIKEQLDE